MNDKISIFQLRKKQSISKYELINLINFYKSIKLKIGFTNGCFDLLHYGHFVLLDKASKISDKLIIGLNSDESIKKIKGNERPIYNQDERAFMLSSLSYVDYVIIFSEETPYELIKLIKPDYLIKGSEYNKNEIVGGEFAKEIITIPMIENISTTNIINKIKKL